MDIKYKEIEAKLFELIDMLKTCFTQTELDEVIEFIKYNEYGLALDTVIDIIIEEDKKINNDILNMMIKLSNIMNLDSESLNKKMIAYIL
ncbi:TPA: MafI family immunity protein [Kluyvera intermedia]|uniref:MafI family immunity protein n=2 Tax=Enterobacteriaceae TaxID=543 RepID=A0AAC8QPC6_9ENTR|nr:MULTISPECIES: MafI family immunity protein [Enterobacteriaceae]HAT2204125.1 MafI family immunity protein [Kluyvera intermedia]AKL12528.1 hypothetical protein AB182_14995 [Phytobacter ursingii]MCL9671427.1 MafI family immunity protein [Citrobacter sp. MNAZ 1397]HAT2514838.1 MafI family immunity protein [Kluyvera intermedia]HAT2604413.1 MafI family immunity protein [Kluyvera intermedia]